MFKNGGMKMRLFGELGCCEYAVSIVRDCARLKTDNSSWEFTLMGEGEKQRYLHLSQVQLEQLMKETGVHAPEEFVGCNVVKDRSLDGTGKIAILPKGAHVELIALDEDGKELEVQFRQY